MNSRRNHLYPVDGTKHLLKLLLILCKYNKTQGSQLSTINYTRVVNEAFQCTKMWNNISTYLDKYLSPTEELNRQSPIALFSNWRESRRSNKHKQALCILWLIVKKKDDIPRKFFNKLHHEFEQYLVSFFPIHHNTESVYATNLT